MATARTLLDTGWNPYDMTAQTAIFGIGARHRKVTSLEIYARLEDDTSSPWPATATLTKTPTGPATYFTDNDIIRLDGTLKPIWIRLKFIGDSADDAGNYVSDVNIYDKPIRGRA